MSENLQIAGVALERVEVEGITYTYPQERIPLEYLALATDLSSAHADGDIVTREANPEKYPAQGAYFLESKPHDHRFVTDTGNLVDSRFEALVDDVWHNYRKRQIFDRWGEHLDSGGTIVNGVPHGSLLDVGVMHAIPYVILGRLGLTFRAGTDISQGINYLGRSFQERKVELARALAWANHKIWFVTPRTKNTEESEFAQVVPADQIIDPQNRVVRADITQEQRIGGMFITAALSATSFVKNGEVYEMVAPTIGSLRTFDHYRTRVSVVAGKIQGAEQPSYEMSSKLRRLKGNDETLARQGDEFSISMTAGQNAAVPGSEYAFQGR